MIGRKRVFYFLALAAISLLAVACGSSDDTGKVDKNPGETDGGLDSDTLNYTGVDTTGLNSFRSEFAMTFVGTEDTGAPIDVRYVVSQVVSTDPPASELVVDAQGAGAQALVGAIQLIQIGTTSYMITPGAGEQNCTSFTDDAPLANQPFFSPDTFLGGGDFSGAKRVRPDETVNGVETRHFRFAEGDVTLSGIGLGAINGDIWVAKDGGYVVRQVISVEGGGSVFGGAEGRIDWTYDLLDINAPVDIQPPVGCSAPIGADFPTMPGAIDVVSFGETISYETAASVEEAFAFYSQQLSTDGWVAGSVDTSVANFVSMTFAREAETATIFITGDDAGGATTVLVTIDS